MWRLTVPAPSAEATRPFWGARMPSRATSTKKRPKTMGRVNSRHASCLAAPTNSHATTMRRPRKRMGRVISFLPACGHTLHLGGEGAPAVVAGVTTYRFYVTLPDEGDRFSAVFGNNDSNLEVSGVTGCTTARSIRAGTRRASTLRSCPHSQNWPRTLRHGWIGRARFHLRSGGGRRPQHRGRREPK